MNVELDAAAATQPLPGSVGAMLAGDATGVAAAPVAHPATIAPAAPATSPATPPADGGPITPDETSGAKTPEEIEAYWRNRVSRKDAAHAAAERTLRDQIASLQAKPAATGSDGQPGSGDSEAVAALQRQLDEERAARIVDQRKGKYPALVAQGVSDETFASSNEADLAKMNALADDTAATGFMAPTAPRRSTTPPAAAKALHEKTKAELEADLRALSPAYAESLRQG